MTVRTDAGGVTLGARPIEVRPDGWRVYRGRIPADVVMDYPDLYPPRSEFIPASEALSDDALASMLGSPFSILHADDLLDATTVREHSVGTVLRAEANWTSDPPEMIVDVIIHDAAAQAEVESGRLAQISPGYRSEEDWTAGEHRGRRYQVVQRKRRYNHLAAVPSARTVTADGRPARLDELPGQRPDAAPYSPTTDARTETMDETETQHGSETDTQTQVRKDAKPPISEEAMEMLKKLPPADLLVVMGALQGAPPMEPDGGEIDPDAIVVDAAPLGGGGEASPDLADIMARIAKLEAGLAALAGGGPAANKDGKDMEQPGKKDGAGAGKGKPNPGGLQLDAYAALAAAEQNGATFAQVARATYDASAKFVAVVHADGHKAVTPTDAAAVMVSVIAEHLPLLANAAREYVNGQRLDALVPLYKQAEQVRRDRALDLQAAGVAECFRVDGDAGHDVVQFIQPRVRGAR